MPIVGDAAEVKKSMKKTYGKDWEKVFYSTANKQGRKAETWKKKAAKLATLLDEIPGGLADGTPDSEFPKDQIREGVETESKEHGGNPAIAKDIAKDHLTEDPKYYDHLDKMEELGSKIMKISALVPQRADSVVPGIKLPLKMVDAATGAPPGAAPAAPAGKPTTPQVAATQPPGAPPQGAPVVPGAPKLAQEAGAPAEYTDPVQRQAMEGRAQRALKRTPSVPPAPTKVPPPIVAPPPKPPTLIREKLAAVRLRAILNEVQA